MMKNIKQSKIPSLSSLTKTVKTVADEAVSDVKDVVNASRRLATNVKGLQHASRQAASWADAVQCDVQRWQSQAQPTIDKLKHDIEKLNK